MNRDSRAVSQLCSIDDLAPAGSATQSEGDKFRDLLDDLSERTRAVDVLEDAAAPALDVSHGGVLAAHFALHDPAPGPGGEEQHQQHADEKDEVANVQQRRPGDDRNIVEGTQQDVEWYLLFGRVDGVGLHDHADAGDADPGSRRNLPHRRKGSVGGRMAINRGEQLAIGDQDKFVLRFFPDRGHHLTLEGDQVVLMAVGVTAVPGSQLAPGRRLRPDWLEDVAVLDFAVVQGQKPVTSVGKAGGFGDIADPQRITGMGRNPQAPGAVLQHNGRAWLIVGDSSLTRTLRVRSCK